MTRRRTQLRPAAAAICCLALIAIAGCGGSSGSASPPATAHTATTSNVNAPTTPAPAPAASSNGNHSGSGANTPGRARSSPGLATFGTEASGGERAAILTALHTYLSAIAAGDWGTACEHLAAPLRKQLELLLGHALGKRGRSCPLALGALLTHTPSALRRQQAQISVLAVRTNGTRGLVLFHEPRLPHAVISMFREDGHWTAGVLAATNAG